jgi:hypothetical protein
VHLRVLALAARGISDHPPHGVARRDGDQLLAVLERDVGHLVDGRIELIECAPGVGIDLNGVDVAVLDGLEARRVIGSGHPVLWRAFVLRLLSELLDRLELSGQRQGLRHLDVLHERLWLGLESCRLKRCVIEQRNLRHPDVGSAAAEDAYQRRRTDMGGFHFGPPEPTSCDQLKVCT